MACITLTRVTLARSVATVPTPGWEVQRLSLALGEVATARQRTVRRLNRHGSSRATLPWRSSPAQRATSAR
jgi:hypothetical protein